MAKPLHRGHALGFGSASIVGVEGMLNGFENGHFARCPVCFGWHKFGIRIVAEKLSGKLSRLPFFVRDYGLFRFLVSVGFGQAVFVAVLPGEIFPVSPTAHATHRRE